MMRSSSLALAALLAASAGACNNDETSPSAPSPDPRQAAVTAAATYTIKNLGTLGGNSSAALDINNMGQTVGWARTSGGNTHAFIYQAGVMRDLGALAGGYSEADAINDAGVAVGYSTLLSGAERAVRWQNGTKKNLGTLGGRNSRATDINGDGIIVGWSENASGNRHAFVYQNGVMKDIGTLGGKTSEANGINQAGKVVGVSRTAAGKNHAFAWINGKFQDLGDGGTMFGFATAVNSGRIVGGFGPPPDAEGGDLEVVQPWVYSAGVFTRIGTQLHAGFANDVNKDGIVVGRDEDDRTLDPGHAWFWKGSGPAQNLPELAEDGFDSAEGINSFGTIVGYSEASDGWTKAVIWRPQ